MEGWCYGSLLEKLFERKLGWLVCDLHTSELPLRHLSIDLDGTTLSNNKLSGPLGKMLDNAMELEIKHNIVKIDSFLLPVVPEDVTKDLSTNKFYAYLFHEAPMSLRLAFLEIGPVNHSRWITIANRFLRIWCSKQGLRGQSCQN